MEFGSQKRRFIDGAASSSHTVCYSPVQFPKLSLMSFKVWICCAEHPEKKTRASWTKIDQVKQETSPGSPKPVFDANWNFRDPESNIFQSLI